VYSLCYLAFSNYNKCTLPYLDISEHCVSDVRRYRQLLGETADPEQSDTDEMEMQLAALVESQQLRCVALLVNPLKPSGNFTYSQV
jgi:hypothetical protein